MGDRHTVFEDPIFVCLMPCAYLSYWLTESMLVTAHNMLKHGLGYIGVTADTKIIMDGLGYSPLVKHIVGCKIKWKYV